MPWANSHTVWDPVHKQLFEMILGQTHILILEGLRKRQVVSGIPLGVHRCSLGELLVSWRHWCWQIPFWSHLSRILVVVQSLSHIWLFVISWTAAFQAPLSSTVSWSLLKFMSIESVMPSNHLFLWCPRLFLTSAFPSISVFSNESALRIRRPKYWSFSFSNSSSNEYSGLISLRIDWFDLAVQVPKTRLVSTSPGSLQVT